MSACRTGAITQLTRLSVSRPIIQAEVVKSQFDSKKQDVAVFSELLDKIAAMWKDRPCNEKRPIMDCDGMESHSVCQMQLIELLVATHLHPKTPPPFSFFSLLKDRTLPVSPRL